MNLRLIMLLGAVLLVFVAVFGLQKLQSEGLNDFLDNMPIPAVSVSVAEVEPMNWANYLAAVGSARAVNGTQLTTQSAGLVTEIRFNSGDQVKKGQILLLLDDDTDRSELQALVAAAELARADHERISRLFDQGSVSKADLDRAKAQADQTRGQLASQQSRVSLKTVRAPFDGTLGIRLVNVGEYLAPGTAVVSVQQLDPIYVDFNLPEQQLSQVHLGQTIEAGFDAWPGQQFEGTVTAIEPAIDRGTRNFRVQATLRNGDQRIRPGMFSRVALDLGSADDVLAVPQTAISYNPYGNAVFVVVEKEEGEGLIVKRRFVRTGRTVGDFVAVVEGLSAGERVATSGLLRLSNDSAVEISDELPLEPSLAPTPNNS